MRFLADENFPGDAVVALQAIGHDVAWVHDDAPGSKDGSVLERAQHEARILLTFDKDFGELAFRSGLPASCGIILFRLRLPSPAAAIDAATRVIKSRNDWSGHFAVIEDDRIRMRPLPAT